ncbi:MAG TPA: malate/lactate/ureidoglycolate dehydrogenase [Gemmataceae bacterium]|nr:malate/lactate/ureidoglycolate dehydrogenase [Gemmataceae bacterium]
MKIPPDRLQTLVSKIFAAAGCKPPEPERIAHYLVESNLVGHDSHGVIRVPIYIQWLREGKVLANQQLKIVFENDCIAIVDGQYGFGQTMGEKAMELGLAKVKKQGVAVVALRNPGHLGRIGDWAEMAARAGILSLHFVNTSGMGILVAPHGGIERRLSANPVAAGIPIPGKPPMIWDISTSTIAEGKLKVAYNKGVPVPDSCIIDPEGKPTNDPKVFYGPPPGAILPFGGHKGFGLGMIAEVLAGALTGNGCSNPAKADRLTNGMLTILLDPVVFQSEKDFVAEVNRFIDYVRSSKKVSPEAEILMPGEIEERNRARRRREGIELDEKTWGQIVATAKSLNVAVEP